jgi:hypothetical protein
VTFTVPSGLRLVAYHNQRTFFEAFFRASSEALSELAADSRHLGGEIGMTGVLHTNSRRLDLHPHIHYIVPAGALDRKRKLWKRKGGDYLLPHNPLSRLFRGKLLALLEEQDIVFPEELYSVKWNINFQAAGSGEHAVEYLARYLYRGVIGEKSIIASGDGKVTFQYQDSDTRLMETMTLPGEDFLMLVLSHVLPKGFIPICLHNDSIDKGDFEECFDKLVEGRYEYRPRPICRNKLKRALPQSGCVSSARRPSREIPRLPPSSGGTPRLGSASEHPAIYTIILNAKRYQEGEGLRIPARQRMEDNFAKSKNCRERSSKDQGNATKKHAKVKK